MRLLPPPIRTLVLLLTLVVLAACQGTPKDLMPVSKALLAKMEQLGMDATAPIYIRIFKQDSALEVWKQQRTGQYALLKTYEICKWSGDLGPKLVEGDRQAPEGFYTVTPGQMNPNSSYYLSFNIGYPNAFDSSLGRTGSNLMVHGACSSAGCYSMTDESAGEIFALARDAFKGGQRSFQVAAFPFHMTPENMAQNAASPNFAFWRMLKEGYDHFEVTHVVPVVNICDKQYVFDADANGRSFDPKGACPAYRVPDAIRVPVAARQAADQKVFASLVKSDKTIIAAAPVKVDLTAPPKVAAASATLGSGASARIDAKAGTVGGSQTTPGGVAVSTPVKKTPSVFDQVFGAGGT